MRYKDFNFKRIMVITAVTSSLIFGTSKISIALDKEPLLEVNFEKKKKSNLLKIFSMSKKNKLKNEIQIVEKMQKKPKTIIEEKREESKTVIGEKRTKIELEKLAENENDSSAQYELATLYYFGRGVKQDYARSLEYYKKSAEQGSPFGQYGLACMYFMGRGVNKNYKEAHHYFNLSAAKDLKESFHSLGMMYLFGKGVKKDLKKAVEYFLICIGKNYERSQDELKKLFTIVKFTEPNPRSEEELRKAVSKSISFLQEKNKSKHMINKDEEKVEQDDTFVSFEMTVLKILEKIKDAGFMITCLSPNEELKTSLCSQDNEENSTIRFYPKLKTLCIGEENVKNGDIFYAMFTQEKSEKYLTINSFVTEIKDKIYINKQALIKFEFDIMNLENILFILNQNQSDLESEIRENSKKVNLEIEEKDIQVLNSEELKKSTHAFSLLTLAAKKIRFEIKQIEQELDHVDLLQKNLAKLLLETAPSRNKLFLEKHPWIR